VYLSQEILNNLNNAEIKIRTLGKGKDSLQYPNLRLQTMALSLTLDEFAPQEEKKQVDAVNNAGNWKLN